MIMWPLNIFVELHEVGSENGYYAIFEKNHSILLNKNKLIISFGSIKNTDNLLVLVSKI